jgi:predicted RecB family nuclease
MRIVDGAIHLSPTDLGNHLACRHLTVLDLAAAEGRLQPPPFAAASAAILQERGRQHEATYVEHLRRQGLNVVDLRNEPLTSDGVAATVAAMAGGLDAIVQAPLVDGRWSGRADVLRKVSTASRFGAWSYEPLDTKLARETRGSTILQLCAYSVILERFQGVRPAMMHVVAPGEPFALHDYRVDDFLAYYRLVRQRLEAMVTAGIGISTYPDPVPHCDVCRWWQSCDERRRTDDHLSLVAGITRLHVEELCRLGLNTLAALGTLRLPIPRPGRGSVEALTRFREQARVQLEGRQRGAPVYELLAIEPDKGLFRLPAPSEGDVFLDIEGDPFVGVSGHEYLFGFATRAGDNWAYTGWWALDPAAERAAFERLVACLMDRWRAHPDFHVYHYAAYEPSALRRLMGKHATCEDDVDRMLRGDLFVDLYGIARQSVLASVERYSIKSLEPFFGFERAIPLREATASLQACEHLLELGEMQEVPDEIRRVVEAYNRDDCLSAAALRDWLETLRAECDARGHVIARPVAPVAEPGEALQERQARVQTLMDRLLAGVPADVAARSPTEHARWLLAQLLEFHRREDKAVWWDFFRLAELPPEERFDEPSALADVQFVARVGGTAKCPIDRYRFAPQEFFARLESQAVLDRNRKLGTLEAIDFDARTVDIKKRADAADVHPDTMFFHQRIDPSPLAEALFRLGEWVADNGVDRDGPYRAARDLLLRLPPRLAPGTPWIRNGESIVDRARRLAVALDRGVLPVQGPPGSGKTFTGARMICSLVRAGRRVGVTATSHKVIRKLLDEVLRAAKDECLDVRCIQKVNDAGEEVAGLVETERSADVLAALQDGEAHVAGGTAWLWAREEFFELVDVLVIDEAGQMSLASVLAAAQAARSIILLGDPQQLEQPLQGSHPEGTAVSVLQHVLGEHDTIPDDRGLFLEETRRLHPSLCAFTSEVFYEGRLRPYAGLERQRLVGPAPFDGAGLWFHPVEHVGNPNWSPEEVRVVATLVDRLGGGDYAWIDGDGQQRQLRREDILIVAPYNAQVYAIQERVHASRVGTVDRFQGQEAPVVIYSMTTSSPGDAPRGMEFLYSLNRLNVATSRARCAVILLANPRIFEPDCQTPRQMRLANAFCRYVEMARPIPAL